MRIAMLTGGGDCPGLNAVIRAVVHAGVRRWNDETVGFVDGWRGVLDGHTVDLDVAATRDLLGVGGTILGTSRTNPFAEQGGPERALGQLDELGIEALVAIGGDDTLGVAGRLHELGAPVVGVPKTIDNDLSATELTFGFDTAVQICVDAIDRLATTSRSHTRVMVVEVMGRHAGHIATWAGIAGGAASVLIPEEPFDIDEVCRAVRERHATGRCPLVVVVAEGAKPRQGTLSVVDEDTDEFGHKRLGGISSLVAGEVERRTGLESRATVLGHTQRGGTPTAFDRVLATRLGVAAVEAVHDRAWGTMVALQGSAIVRVPLAVAAGEAKLVDPGLFHGVAELFFG